MTTSGAVIITGDLVEVEEVEEGSSLLGDHAVDATELDVANIDDYGEQGICLIKKDVDVDGNPIYESYTYTTVDEYEDLDDIDLEDLIDDEAGPGTIIIDPPLVAAAEDGTEVIVCNAWGKPETTLVAWVQLYDDDPEPTPIDVPTPSRGYLEVGHFQAGSEVQVESVGLDYRLVTLPREQPAMDAGVLDPGTFEPAGITPLQLHQDAVAAIEDDIAATLALIADGDSDLAQEIDDLVDEINLELATRPPTIESESVPGATANVAGTIWEQYHDLTPTPGQPRRLIAAWRGLGGTSWMPVSIDPVYIPVLDINTGTAGSLMTSRLLVSAFDNLLNDPGFVLPLGTSWEAPGYASIDATGGRGGTRALRITNSGVQNFVYNLPVEILGVEAGQSYRLRVAVKGTVAIPAAGCRIAVQWLLAGGSSVQTIVDSPAVASGTWGTVEGTVTAPADAVKMSVFVSTVASFATGQVLFHAPMVTRAAGGELIVDGGILARHITADMVSGLLLSGRVIETNPLASRGIKMSDAGFIGYDSTGVARTVIDPNTGLISAQGALQTIGSSANIYVAHRIITNFFETSQQWPISEYGVASGWGPGQVWGSHTSDHEGSGVAGGQLRLSSPYENADTWTAASYLNLWCRADGTSGATLIADMMNFSADSWTIGSGAGSVDFNIFGSNLFQLQQLVGSNRFAVGLGGIGTIKVAASNKSSVRQELELEASQLRFDVTGAHEIVFNDLGGSNIPGFVRNDLGSGLRWAANRSESHNGIGFVPHAASSHPIGSDAGWKKYRRPVRDAVEMLRAVDAERWTWRRTHGTLFGETGLGFVAQEVAPVIPEAIHGFALADGGDGLMIDPVPLLAVLWTAAQRLDDRLTALEGAA